MVAKTTKKKTARAKKAEPTPPRLLRRERRNMEVLLTEPEQRERSRELAVTHRELHELAAEADSWKKMHKARVVEVESRQSRLATEVETGKTYRDVFVEVRADDDAGEAVTVRTDTGEEVSRRKLQPDESPRMFDDPELPMYVRAAWDLGCQAKGTERENPYGDEDARFDPLRSAWDSGRAGKPLPDDPDAYEWGKSVGAFERKKESSERDEMPCPWPNAESLEAQRFEAGRANKPDPHPPE